MGGPPVVARVVDVVDQGQALLVASLTGPDSGYTVRCALPAGASPQRGAEVLVIESDQGPLAIALLGLALRELALTDGTQVRASADGAALEIMRADGTLLFKYNVSQGQGRITLENDAVDVHAVRGDLRLRAAGDVLVEGRTVQAVSRNPGADSTTRFQLSPRQASLSAATVNINGDDLQIAVAQTTLRSEEVRGFIGRAVVQARRIETVAAVISETAQNLYQAVEELAQLRAGSLRTIVDGSVHLKAKQVFQRAAEAFKIRAEKIHLG
jgi:hypothetical protein